MLTHCGRSAILKTLHIEDEVTRDMGSVETGS